MGSAGLVVAGLGESPGQVVAFHLIEDGVEAEAVAEGAAEEAVATVLTL